MLNTGSAPGPSKNITQLPFNLLQEFSLLPNARYLRSYSSVSVLLPLSDFRFCSDDNRSTTTQYFTRVSAPCTNSVGGLSTCESKVLKGRLLFRSSLYDSLHASHAYDRGVLTTDRLSYVAGLRPSPLHPLYQKSLQPPPARCFRTLLPRNFSSHLDVQGLKEISWSFLLLARLPAFKAAIGFLLD